MKDPKTKNEQGACAGGTGAGEFRAVVAEPGARGATEEKNNAVAVTIEPAGPAANLRLARTNLPAQLVLTITVFLRELNQAEKIA